MGDVVRFVHKSADCGDTDGLVTPDAFTAAGSGKADSLFDVANLRFALVICVDHHQKRARREYEARHGEKSLRTGEGVDVHIVTGAGQVANPASVVARPGGLVISADASEGIGKVESSPGRRTRSRRVTASGSGGTTRRAARPWRRWRARSSPGSSIRSPRG